MDPKERYKSKINGDQIDVALERALPGGAIDLSLSKNATAYPNRNMVDNGALLVNQRAQDIYTGQQYGVDRFKIEDASGQATLTVTDTTVTFALSAGAPADQSWLTQYLDYSFDGREYTLSINALSKTGVPSVWCGANSGTPISDGVTALTCIPTGNIAARIVLTPGQSVVLPRGQTAIKLEIGSASTLVNDPPANYGEDIDRCKRYYRKWTTEAARTDALKECELLRTTPVLGTLTIGNTTYYTAIADL